MVFNNFLLIDETERSKISSDQKRLFFAVSLYPLSFFVNTPFKVELPSLPVWQVDEDPLIVFQLQEVELVSVDPRRA